jgi:hypothetical protein
MKVFVIPVTPFQQNCSLAICEATQRAAIVDPGGDLELIERAVAEHGATVEKVLLTHGHVDHCAGAKTLAEHYGVPIEGPHRDEKFWIDQLPDQSVRFGFPAAQAFEPDRWLDGGDTVQFGDETLDVYHCPGHTPGHVVFVSARHQKVPRRLQDALPFMHADTGRCAAIAPPGPRAHLHENERAIPIAHDEIDLAASASDVARHEAHALPLQEFERLSLERGSDAFRLTAPGKVVHAVKTAASRVLRCPCTRRCHARRVAQ